MKVLNRGLAAACVAVAISIAGTAHAASLMITGVVDGTLAADGGGSPKFVELYALENITDLSLYALSRAGNGSTSFDAFTADFKLPAVALSAGQFYYAVGNSFVDMTATFDTVLPGKSRARNFGVNSNGDDVTGLFFHPTGDFVGDLAGVEYIDVVGALGVDGTGTPWDHIDSYLYRKNGELPTTTFDVNDWIVAGIDVLDNLTAEQIGAAFPDGTYAVPEPSALALAAISLLGVRRRRNN